ADERPVSVGQTESGLFLCRGQAETCSDQHYPGRSRRPAGHPGHRRFSGDGGKEQKAGREERKKWNRQKIADRRPPLKSPSKNWMTSWKSWRAEKFLWRSLLLCTRKVWSF